MPVETETVAIVGGQAATPAAVIDDSLILVAEGRIAWVGKASENEPPPGARHVEARGLTVAPGFIDTHVHGSNGFDVMHTDAGGIRAIGAHLATFGVTAWLPSTVSARHDDLLRAVTHCRVAWERPGEGARIVGIHIEGPYINPLRKGAQPEEGIRDPDADECRELLAAAGGLTRVMTLAPELPEGLDLIGLLVAEGVIASLGHSDADYETALAAIAAGATHATHLFNAMPPLHHRKPGLAAAALTEPELIAEVIADGLHLAPETVRLAVRAKGPDGIALITDATAAVGRPDGEHTLGSHRVIVHGDLCLLPDGTIAGSMLTMNRAARNAIAFSGCSLAEAIRMATLVPAQIAGVADRKGSLEPGKDADLVLLRPDFTVAATMIEGRMVYESPSRALP
jgi:N-acetylglucosamine-6-phosphate deacetylase